MVMWIMALETSMRLSKSRTRRRQRVIQRILGKSAVPVLCPKMRRFKHQ